MKKTPTYKLQCDCGTLVTIKNGRGNCSKCGAIYGGAIHKASKPQSRRKKPVDHSLDPRDWWIFPALIVAGVIGYGMYMDGLLWLFALVLAGLITVRIVVGGKKRRKA